MDNYKISVSGTFGSADEDINKIYLLASDNNKIDSIYVEYNDGVIEVEDRPEEVDYATFSAALQDFMKNVGITNADKNSKWYITKRENNWGINFDELDAKYDEQHKVTENEELNFNVDDENLAQEEEPEVVVAPIVTDNFDENIPEATIVDEEIVDVPDEVRVNEANVKKEHKIARNALLTAAVALAGVAIGAGGYELWNHFKEKAAAKKAPIATDEVIDLPGVTTPEATIAEEGYGYYNFDLSNYETIDEYFADVKIPDSDQKEAAKVIYEASLDINQEVELTDESKEVAGLETKEATAMYIYSNLLGNKLEADIVQEFGPDFDYENIAQLVREGSLDYSTALAHPEFDGKPLAKLFDEDGQTIYLKLMDYRDRIVNSENEKDKNAAVKELNEYLYNVVYISDKAVSEDYREELTNGTSIAIQTVVMGLIQYDARIDISANVRDFIMGNEDKDLLSLIDQGCAKMSESLDNLVVFARDVNDYLLDPSLNIESIKYENLSDNEKFAVDYNVSAKYENLSEMDKLKVDNILDNKKGTSIYTTNAICSWAQIDALMQNSLEKENKLVTDEGQKKITEDNTKRLQEAAKAGIGAKFATKRDQVISEALDRDGVYVETTHVVAPGVFDENSIPNNIDPSSQEKIKNEIEKDKKKREEKFKEDMENAEKTAQQYIDEVIAYYQANTSQYEQHVVPSSLQEHYNALGDAVYWASAKTGYARGTDGEDLNPEPDLPPVVDPPKPPQPEPTPAPTDPTPTPTPDPTPSDPTPTPEVPTEPDLPPVVNPDDLPTDPDLPPVVNPDDLPTDPDLPTNESEQQTDVSEEENSNSSVEEEMSEQEISDMLDKMIEELANQDTVEETNSITK